jgi:hypothetical protein
MSDPAPSPSPQEEPIRVLFCFGVTPSFFSETADGRKRVFEALQEAFSDLRGRFGVDVLGTIDDDQLMVGSSTSWPWICYILADVPSYRVACDVCNLLRVTEVGEHRLFNYLRVEARLGRPLFFGNE